jgi:hypothetical protein
MPLYAMLDRQGHADVNPKSIIGAYPFPLAARRRD